MWSHEIKILKAVVRLGIYKHLFIVSLGISLLKSYCPLLLYYSFPIKLLLHSNILQLFIQYIQVRVWPIVFPSQQRVYYF